MREVESNIAETMVNIFLVVCMIAWIVIIVKEVIYAY